jgi:hypothetical protein
LEDRVKIANQQLVETEGEERTAHINTIRRRAKSTFTLSIIRIRRANETLNKITTGLSKYED